MLSINSRSSSGGSSGYLGSASSGLTSSSGGSGRSRLSLMPELGVEPHRVVGPLPHKKKVSSSQVAASQDSMVVQVGSQAAGLPKITFADDRDMADKIIASQKVDDG